ncbi:MAG TPA: AraC family transcriptional regulator [Haliscomenobacter sp.]|uniref:AraC family transcriptional regulator n=1 Tax=Haliscomenobacter sp. TaxID=2717303 RepID=UPI002B576D66|nr:AraC family transcriptional regulator [Haliscomenobacter sp.]HOY18767.1 AraC family transcriptional regulator [Haliscomenobacter sp.]
MKIKFEDIRPDSDSSFRILLTPRLHNTFLWHYHPEYELVYIEGANGTRHIGDHISRYEGSDLVFIGPNVPHLNFDYGVETEHHKVVVQLKADFLGKDFFQAPEMKDVRKLFEQAREGVSFFGETKKEIGARLKDLTTHNHFRQLLELLDIFQTLAESWETQALGAKPLQNEHKFADQQRLQRMYHFVEQHYRDRIDMEEVIALSNLSNAAFCRYFKRMTGMTFTAFLNQYRINQSKRLLLQHCNVSEACYGSGFENLSHFNKTFKKMTGENPKDFRRRHLHLH